MPQVSREHISTPSAPKLPFSQAVRVGDTCYLSGCIGSDASGKIPTAFEEQARNTLKNVGIVLKAAGLEYSDVVKATVLLSDIRNFATLNDIYKEFFTAPFPARTAYQAAALPYGALVEIEVIADATKHHRSKL